MSEVMTFSFLKDIYQELSDSEISIEEFLNDILDDGYLEDQSNSDLITGQLASLHSRDGGSPSVDQFKIVDVAYNADLKRGILTFEYCVHYYFGCSDMDNEVETDEECHFWIDEEKSELTIEFKEPIVRDTFEEF